MGGLPPDWLACGSVVSDGAVRRMRPWRLVSLRQALGGRQRFQMGIDAVEVVVGQGVWSALSLVVDSHFNGYVPVNRCTA